MRTSTRVTLGVGMAVSLALGCNSTTRQVDSSGTFSAATGSNTSVTSATVGTEGSTGASAESASQTSTASDSSGSVASVTGSSGSGGSVDGTSDSATGGSGTDACDGLPESQCECAPDETTTCLDEYAAQGLCGKRSLTCLDSGLWPAGGACAPDSDELCDADLEDEDCDGEVNEDCTCKEGDTLDCGQDNDGVQECVDGQWGPCECGADGSIDVDENSIADSLENLVENPHFAVDIDAWQESDLDDPEDLFAWDSTDAKAADCSGSLWMYSWENSADVFASQCLTATEGDYVAAVEVMRPENSSTNDDDDAFFARVELRSYATTDCSGTILDENWSEAALDDPNQWLTLSTSLFAQAGTAAVQISARTMGAPYPYDYDVTLHFDNFLLRED